MKSITETEIKLRDAGIQMKLALEKSENDKVFHSCINAYISAGRSVTMIMEKESSENPHLLTWYKTKMAELGQLPLMKFFNSQRVHTIHRGNVTPVTHGAPIWDLRVEGDDSEYGTGTIIWWTFDNAKEFMPDTSDDVLVLCEEYFMTLKHLVAEWLFKMVTL